jgi:hypothetical protein
MVLIYHLTNLNAAPAVVLFDLGGDAVEIADNTLDFGAVPVGGAVEVVCGAVGEDYVLAGTHGFVDPPLRLLAVEDDQALNDTTPPCIESVEIEQEAILVVAENPGRLRF